MMRRGGLQDRLRFAEPGIGVLPALEEARHSARADRDMLADPHITVTQLARDDRLAPSSSGFLDPEQVRGQSTFKAPVDVEHGLDGGRLAGERAFVDPALGGDVRFGLFLQIAFFLVLAVVSSKRSFDIDWVRVVAFNEVAVIAVHRAHDIADGCDHAVGQAGSELGSGGIKLEHQLVEAPAVP